MKEGTRFDPKKWQRSFSPGSLTKYIPCPNCHRYELQVGEEDIRYSKPLVVEDDPSSLEYRFSACVRCGRCGEPVTLCGDSDEGWVMQQIDENDWEDYHYESINPHFIYPHPRLFSIPSDCPEKVKEALVSAFSLYWCDINACAGRLRAVVELILDAAGIKRRNETGGLIWLSNRLKSFKEKNASIAKMLEATNLLGNESLHELSVKEKDVDNALRVISFALTMLYESKEYEKLADEIIQEKDPRQKKHEGVAQKAQQGGAKDATE